MYIYICMYHRAAGGRSAREETKTAYIIIMETPAAVDQFAPGVYT